MISQLFVCFNATRVCQFLISKVYFSVHRHLQSLKRKRNIHAARTPQEKLKFRTVRLLDVWDILSSLIKKLFVQYFDNTIL